MKAQEREYVYVRLCMFVCVCVNVYMCIFMCVCAYAHLYANVYERESNRKRE